MATTTRKKAAAKPKAKAAKTTTRRAPAARPRPASRTVVARPVDELFHTQEQPAPQQTVAPGHALLYINGHSRGDISLPTTGTVLDWVKAQASQQGIRNFAAYLNGEKVDSSTINRYNFRNLSKVEIMAKDARGSSSKPEMAAVSDELRSMIEALAVQLNTGQRELLFLMLNRFASETIDLATKAALDTIKQVRSNL